MSMSELEARGPEEKAANTGVSGSRSISISEQRAPDWRLFGSMDESAPAL
jgi:hypothetical protein